MAGFPDTFGELEDFEMRRRFSREPTGAIESRVISSNFILFFCRACSSLTAVSSGRISLLIASSTAESSFGLLMDDAFERTETEDLAAEEVLKALTSDGSR
jgi:hypothetical protein